MVPGCVDDAPGRVPPVLSVLSVLSMLAEMVPMML